MIAQTGTQSTDRAAQLLLRVVESREPLAVGELAAVTGLPKSTASRLLGSLERAGLVQRDGVRGGVRPGPALLRFAQRGVDGDDIAALADGALRELAAISGETVNLAVPAHDGPDTIAEIETDHVLGTGGWVGRRGIPQHASAFGKVFIAFGAARLPRGELVAVAPRTITDRRRFETELARIRAVGYATAVDELEEGLAAVAAPVRGALGEVVAALAISGPTLRMPVQRLEALGRLCVEQAAVLSAKLGSPPIREGAA
jgi:IclR family transcriptional regulator, acetate operon repressor